MVNRIRELLEAHQLSPTQFADFIGVGRPVISHILSERNEPSLKVVQKVSSAFPDVSLAWLVSGSGPMLKTTAPDSPPLTTSVGSTPVAPPASALLSVSLPPSALPGPFTSPPVAPTPAMAPAPLAATTSASPATLAATQPPQLPQPPKFRPGTAAQPASLPASALPPVTLVPIPSTEVPAIAVAPALSASALVEVGGVSLPPAQPATAAPAFPELTPAPASVPESAGPAPLSGTIPAATSVTTAASPAIISSLPAPNPAAAFSFLGEAGKTIRRIVLFYSDGSFSDYRPEEQ